MSLIIAQESTHEHEIAATMQGLVANRGYSETISQNRFKDQESVLFAGRFETCWP